MSQERLNTLAIISIENKIANDINIDDVRLKFSTIKARKATFSKQICTKNQ